MRIVSAFICVALEAFLVGCTDQAEAPAHHSATPIVQVTPPAGMKWRALTNRTFAPNEKRRARGQYLTEGLLQCFVCHSERDWSLPGAPPMIGRKGAGLVWRDDGKTRLVAPNLTPDRKTGAGTWTDDMFARAIREGVGHDGRLLHPAMPYHSFSRLSDEDLASVVVYLRTLPPVRNPLPQTVQSAEELRRNSDGPHPILAAVPEPDLSILIARGRYLAGLADCAGCHTDWEAPRMAGLYGGGNLVARGTHSAFSSNLTPDRSGVDYDADGFIVVIRTGKGGTLNSVMPWTVFRNLDDTDLRAIHAFLQTLHPVRHFVSNLVPATYCEVCGQKHGLGEMNHIERPKSVAVDPRLFDALVGTYRNDEFHWTLRITRDDNRLMAQDNDRPAAVLFPLSKTRFVLDGGVAPLRFELGPDGRAARIVSEEGDEVALQRMP